MGLRFRRSIKVLPGVRLNLSKSGLGISAGPRGFHVGMDARGKQYVSAGIPGTGISSRHYASPAPAHRPATIGGLVVATVIVAAVVAVMIAVIALLMR
jgi:hypothetical protein